MRRTAIVAVHGVIPHLEHDFQDQVATALRDRLNGESEATVARAPAVPGRTQRGPDRDGTGMPRGTDGETWTMDVVFPTIATPGPDPVAKTRPSIVRVHKAKDKDAANPTDDYYDVIEAYWSPIDKGKTNALSVLKWLLGVVFNPINTTARYGGGAAKARSDVLAISAFVVVGLLAFALCLIAFGNALAITLAHINLPAAGSPPISEPAQTNVIAAIWKYVVNGWGSLWTSLPLLWNPTAPEVKKLFAAATLLRLALGAIGAFLVAQAVRAVISIVRQRTALSRIPIQLRSRVLAVGWLIVIAIVLMSACAFSPFDGGKQLGTVSLWLVVSALMFEAGKSAVMAFIANFFGDVRIRGFVTFGTSLEKTRYFLDAYNPSFSASFAEWRDDYYGVLFDPNKAVLQQPNGDKVGIYWANYWFFSDFIADRISTYCSFMRPHQEVSRSSSVRRDVHRKLPNTMQAAVGINVAQNRASFRLPSLGHPILHGDYLDADWFWGAKDESKPSLLARLLGYVTPSDPERDEAMNVLDIVTSHDHVAPAAELALKAAVVELQVPEALNYRLLSAEDAKMSPLSDVIMR